MKKIIIIGFGGHSRSVGDIALSCGFEHLLFVDSNARAGESFLGFEVVSNVPKKVEPNTFFFSGSGDNKVRKEHFDFFDKNDLLIANLIAPTASISHGAVIKRGCLIGHHAHVGSMAEVGEGSIINTGAIVDHEAIVDDFCHVSINATMAGRSFLGSFSFLGASATIIDTIKVMSNCVIGANACVVKDITVSGTYVGSPALKTKQ